MNKEIEELLNKMKTILKTYKELKVEPTLCEELITTGELNLLLSYIEQLEKEMTLNKIAILKNKIENKYDIELVIKDINDIFNYFKENEVWQEYSEMYLLFMETYNTCLMANNRGGNNEK